MWTEIATVSYTVETLWPEIVTTPSDILSYFTIKLAFHVSVYDACPYPSSMRLKSYLPKEIWYVAFYVSVCVPASESDTDVHADTWNASLRCNNNFCRNSAAGSQ